MHQDKTQTVLHNKWGKTWAATGLVAGSLFLGTVGTTTGHAAVTETPTSGDASTQPTPLKAAQTADEVPLTKMDNNEDDETAVKGENTDSVTQNAPETPDKPEVEAGQQPTADKKAPADSAPVQTPDEATPPVTTPVTQKLADQPEEPAAPAAVAAPTVAKATVESADQTIDDWMPDKNLQQLVLKTLQDKQVDVKSVADITPDMLQQLTGLKTDRTLQKTDESYYQMMAGIKSLKGLEKATNLTSIDLSLLDSTSQSWSTADNGALSDVSALANATKLTNLQFNNQDISEIGALKDTFQAMNDSGGFAIVSLMNNHIFDVRALMVQNKAQWFIASVNKQTLTLPEVTLNPGTTSFITSSPAYSGVHYDRNDPRTNNKVIAPLQRTQGSTATGTVIGDMRYISWSDFSGPTGKLIYTIEQRNGFYDDDPIIEPFTWDGTITVPYKLIAGTGSMGANFKFINGVTIAPDVTLSGTTGDQYDVLNTNAVQETIKALNAKGFDYIEAKNDQATTGEFGADADRIILIFGYRQLIHLVDENGVSIAPDQKYVGDIDDTWNTSIPTIAGYTYDRTVGATPVTDPTTNTQTLSGNLNGLHADIYVYYKVADVKQAVNFLAPDGTALQPATSVTGAVGTTQTVALPTVDGYVVDHTTARTVQNGQLSVTMSQSTDPINVYYKLAEYKQVVNFLAPDGTALQPATSVTGVADSDQTVTLPTVDGYVVDHTTAGTVKDGQLNVTISKDEAPINVYYKLAEYKQVVNFLAPDGTVLQPATSVTGVVDSTQTIALPTVEGYVVDHTTAGTVKDGQLNVTINKSEDPINVYYKLAESHQVILFVDPEGKTLAPATQVTGVPDSVQTVTLPIIDGYRVDHATSGVVTAGRLAVTMTKSNDPITVTFKRVIERGQVTVHYQDQEGNQLANDQVLTGDVGTAYVTSPAAEISSDDYVLITTPFNAVGNYLKADQNVVYLYKLVIKGGTGDGGNTDNPGTPETPIQPETPTEPTAPVTPITPVQPMTPDQTVQDDQVTGADAAQVTPAKSIVLANDGGDAATIHDATTAKSRVTTTKKQGGQAVDVLATHPTVADKVAKQRATTGAMMTLPQTDEHHSSGLTIVGLGVLTGLLGFFGIKLRRQ